MLFLFFVKLVLALDEGCRDDWRERGGGFEVSVVFCGLCCVGLFGGCLGLILWGGFGMLAGVVHH